MRSLFNKIRWFFSDLMISDFKLFMDMQKSLEKDINGLDSKD